MREQFLRFLDRLLAPVYCITLAIIFLRPSFLKLETPLCDVRATSARIPALLLCALWAAGALISPRRYLVRSGAGIPFLLFLGVGCVSAVLSPFGTPAERAEAVFEMILYAAFFFASLYMLLTAIRPGSVLAIMYSVAVVVAVVNLSYHYSKGTWLLLDQDYPLWDGKNAQGLFMVLALCAGSALAFKWRGAKWLSILFCFSLFFLFLGAIYSYSRAAWLALSAAALSALVTRSWKWVSLLMAAVLALTVLPHRKMLTRFLATGGVRDRNVSMRVAVWGNAVRMIRAYPIVGVGPGEFRRAYGALCMSDELARGMEAKDKNHRRFRNHAHNLFLQVGAEMGLAGLAVMLWGAAIVFLALRRGIAERDEGFRQSAARGIGAALAAFLAFSLVDCSWTGRFAGGSFMHINFTIALLIAIVFSMGEPT